MSVLYCAIPHFAAALARRENPALGAGPLILVGPENRVFGVSAEAAACGVVDGMPVRAAEVRCPEARLVDADVARCRQEQETLLELLERAGPLVEPHGWGAAYVGLPSSLGCSPPPSRGRPPGSGPATLCVRLEAERQVGRRQAVSADCRLVQSAAMQRSEAASTAGFPRRGWEPGQNGLNGRERAGNPFNPFPEPVVSAANPSVDSLHYDQAITLCAEMGRAVRHEMGQALQPALGWDSTKFTAQAAGRYTQPGRLRAIESVRERDFLRPLSVALLPLAADVLQRLHFLGLWTLGQYAALPSAAVSQQFGKAGKQAQRCARGEDDRPIIPREQAVHLSAEMEFEAPLDERERLVAALRALACPLLDELHEGLQACGQVRLTAHFDNGLAQEKERTFLLSTSDEARVMQALERLLDEICHNTAAFVPTLCVGTSAPALRALSSSTVSRGIAQQNRETVKQWNSETLELSDGDRREPTGIIALSVTLDQIQDAVPKQLSLFPLQDEREGKLQEVQHYLVARFGANHLRRAMLAQPGAPLPEWRVSWQNN